MAVQRPQRRQEEEETGIDWMGALMGGLGGAGTGYLMSQMLEPEDEAALAAIACQEAGGLWNGVECVGVDRQDLQGGFGQSRPTLPLDRWRGNRTVGGGGPRDLGPVR